MPHTIPEEVRYRLLRYLSDHPEASQRDLAQYLGISLGKVNYCLHALIEHGWVKIRNFKNSRNKAAYAYYLTARGLEQKVAITMQFLQRKIAEHNALTREIDVLRAEVAEVRVEPTAVADSEA
jgi:EPS-associated MarR family transcriptional regulator